MLKISPNLLDVLHNKWPQILWGILLFALGANIIYLVAPKAPATLVVTPHPAVSYTALEQLPVLAEAPMDTHGEKNYLIMKWNPADGDKTSNIIKKFSVKTSSASKHSKSSFTGKVNINKASIEQLQLLPGIGPKMAERILDYRKKHGTFNKPQDLLEIPGIGAKKLEKILPYLHPLN